MICVAWIDVPGVGEINYLWDSGRFPVCVIRGEELSWRDYVQAFGSAGAVQYETLAWENRIEWSPAQSIDWHKKHAGVYEVTGEEIDWQTWGNDLESYNSKSA